MIIAKTDRLILRRLTLDDAPAFKELCDDPEVTRYTGVTPYASLDAAKAHMQELLDRYERDDFGRWAVVRASDDEFLGWCGLRPVEREGVDLGFWLFPRFWGQGFATEAARVSVDLAFGRFELPYLLGRFVAANAASGGVLTKLGFEPWLKTSGHGYDDVRYTILRPPDAAVADPSLDVVCSAAGLSARLLQPADQLDFFMLEGNPNVLRYADGDLYSFDQAAESIVRFRESAADLRVFAVSSPDRQFVGTVATVVEGDSIEIGYRLLEACWGQGLGRPIAALALAVARQEYSGRRVFARCDLRNDASLRVLASLGGTRGADEDGHATWEW